MKVWAFQGMLEGAYEDQRGKDIKESKSQEQTCTFSLFIYWLSQWQ